MKRLLKLIKNLFMKLTYLKSLLFIWLIYILITGVFIFIKPRKVSEDYKESSSVDSFYSDDIGPDRGILMDNPLDSGLARLKIIDSAEERLDIAYFSIEAGETPNLFFGALIDAADRGVQVNLLLDGIFHGLKWEFRSIAYIFSNHPNMNLKFYEPPNPFLPWTFNNRMHDKYILADNKYAMIGGRNIGDKYFAPEWYKSKITNDRDVIIINTGDRNDSSVVYDMAEYFDSIWTSKFSKSIIKKSSNYRSKRYQRISLELKNKANLAKEVNKDLFNKPMDLMKVSFPTNKISFIHNPIERFSKEPWVWYEITNLMKSAKKSIFIQSPYIIPSRGMIQGFVDESNFIGIDIRALTNSLASTPNLPAYSGYMNHRTEIIDSGMKVYEYQSQDSLHTKAFIIDDDILALGTFNSDPRSTYLSTESMIIIHSNQAAKKLEEGLVPYLDESLLVGVDYEYIEKDGLSALPVPGFKKLTVKLLSYITRFFEYLL